MENHEVSTTFDVLGFFSSEFTRDKKFDHIENASPTEAEGILNWNQPPRCKAELIRCLVRKGNSHLPLTLTLPSRRNSHQHTNATVSFDLSLFVPLQYFFLHLRLSQMETNIYSTRDGYQICENVRCQYLHLGNVKRKVKGT